MGKKTFPIVMSSIIPKGPKGDKGDTGGVNSVNGKTGEAVLDAGDLGYDASETYSGGTVGAAVSQLPSQIDDNYSHITTGDFVPPLEIGDYDISGGSIVPKDRKYYVRTSSAIDLHTGDTITLSTLSGYAYYVLAKYSGTNTWVAVGVKYAKFTVAKDGEYHLTIRKNPQDASIVYTKPSDLGTTPIIHDTYSISDRLSSVESQIEPTENVQNNFSLSGGRLYSYYGQFPNGGMFTINRMPASTRIGFQGYSDDRYTTKVFDSGWITDVPYSTSVNPRLFYMVMIANYDYSAITDISVGDDFNLIYEYDLDDKFAATDRAIKNREPWQLLTVKSIAHRGEPSSAPQCTEPAYVYAAKNGFRYAENDVSLTSGGELVMWHDVNLERLGNLVDINGYEIYTDNEILYYYNTSTSKLYTYTTQYVESEVSVSSLTRCNGDNYRTQDLTLAELKRIDFGRYVGEAFAGTTILTFAEWVLLCKKLGLGLYIDAKISYTSANVAEMVEAIQLCGMGDYVTWLNINTTAEIDLIRTYDTKSRILTLLTPTGQNVSDFASYADGKFGYDPNGNTLTAEQAELALSNGYLLEAYYVGTVNDKQGTVYNKINSLLGMGVQGLTLDSVRIEDAIQFLYM